jgi:hypothetical protein
LAASLKGQRLLTPSFLYITDIKIVFTRFFMNVFREVYICNLLREIALSSLLWITKPLLHAHLE